MTFCFKNTNINTKRTEEEEEHYRKKNACRFCEKEKHSRKIRGRCHLTGRSRVPAHQNCNKLYTGPKQFCAICIS